jgi:hypothetical protein
MQITPIEPTRAVRVGMARSADEATAREFADAFTIEYRGNVPYGRRR